LVVTTVCLTSVAYPATKTEMAAAFDLGGGVRAVVLEFCPIREILPLGKCLASRAVLFHRTLNGVGGQARVDGRIEAAA
jgi:hypothetical protein